MLLIALIGWTIVLPILAVSGLYVAARVLGARARRRGVSDETGFARELQELTVREAHRRRAAAPDDEDEAREPVTLGA